MNRVSTAHGHATFTRNSVKLVTFALSPPFKRIFASSVHKRLGSSRIASGTLPIAGEFFIEELQVPDDSILLLQSTSTLAGRTQAQNATFLRVRKDAAFLDIRLRIPPSADRRLDEWLSVFNGRADIITEDWLEEVGIEASKTYLSAFSDEEERDELLQIVEFLPEVAPAPKIVVETSSTGEEVKIKVVRPRRIIRVRSGQPK